MTNAKAYPASSSSSPPGSPARNGPPFSPGRHLSPGASGSGGPKGGRAPLLTISRSDSRSILLEYDGEEDDAHMSDDPALCEVIMPRVMDEQLLRSLSRRGKAAYHCPLGWKCRIGGVDDSGTKLFIFRHNSAFRQHVERHMKPFKCDVPGCWKKCGFARPITLRKHQQMCALREAGENRE